MFFNSAHICTIQNPPKIVWVGLGVGVAASAAAMILNPVAAVLVMGVIVITNAPYAAFKEHRITKLPGKCVSISQADILT